MEFHVPQDRIRIFIPGFDSNPAVGFGDFFFMVYDPAMKAP